MNYNNLYQKKSLLNTTFDFFQKDEPNFLAFENINKNSVNEKKNRNGLLPTPPPLHDSFSSQQRDILSSESFFPTNNTNIDVNRDSHIRTDKYHKKDSSEGLLPLPEELITDKSTSKFANKFNSNASGILEKKSRFSDSILPSQIVNKFKSSKQKIDKNDISIKDKQVKKSRFQDSIDIESVNLNKTDNIPYFNQKSTNSLDLIDVYKSSNNKTEFESKDLYKTCFNDKRNNISTNALDEASQNFNHKSEVISPNFKINDQFYNRHNIDVTKINSDKTFNIKSNEPYKNVNAERTIKSLTRGRIRYHSPQNNFNKDKPKDVLSWQTLIHKSKCDKISNKNDILCNLSDKDQKRFSLRQCIDESDAFQYSSHGKDFIPGICEDAEVCTDVDSKIEAQTANNTLLLNQKIRLFELFKQCQRRALNKTANNEIISAETSIKDHINDLSHENKDVLSKGSKENCIFSSIPIDEMSLENLNNLSLDDIIGLYNDTINNIFKPDSDIKLNEKDIEIMQNIQETFNNTKLSLNEASKNTLKNIPIKLNSHISKKGLSDKSTLFRTDKNDKNDPAYRRYKSFDYRKSRSVHDNNSKRNLNRNHRNKNGHEWNKQRCNNHNGSRNNNRFGNFGNKDDRSSGDGLLDNPYIHENNLMNNMNSLININPLNSLLISNHANILQSNLALNLLAVNLQKNIFSPNINSFY